MDHFKMGKFIAEARKKQGLTQEEVARRLGITSQAVSKWEKGVNVPDISFLKELSEILGVEVEELLKGERNSDRSDSLLLEVEDRVVENKKSEGKVKRRLRYVVTLFVFVFLISGILIGYLTIKEDRIDDLKNKIPHKNQERSEFVEIDKDDDVVFKSLSYVDFMLDTNEELVKKLFDNNKGAVRQDDFTIDEKMFLLLNQFHKKSGLIYYCEDCYFKKEELRGILFEDTSFVDEYAREGKKFNIQDSIALKYERGMFVAAGETGADIGAPSYVFDVLDARKSNDTLVIDFKVAFLKVDFDKEEVEWDNLYVNYGDVKESLIAKEGMLRWNEQFKFYQASLGDTYHTFRYTLKVDGENVYFESLERIS